MERTRFETLNNSGALFSFPPHRRRHLKSETFCTLVRILSHCHGESHLHSREAVQEETKQGNGEYELGQVTGPETCGEPVVLTAKESEISLIQREDQGLKFLGSDECVNEDRMEIDKFDNANRIEEVHIQENGIKIGNTLEDRDQSGNVVSMVDNQESQSSPLDKESYNCKVDEALDLSLDMDAAAESPKLDEKIVDGSIFMEMNLSEEVGRDMQLLEVKKLVSNSGEMNSPLCVTANEEIEEGEISGNSRLYDQSIDSLLENAVSSERKEVDKEQNSVAILNKEQSIYKEHKGAIQEDKKPNSYFAETVDSVVNEAGMELRESNFSKMECKSEMVLWGKNGEDKTSHGHDFVLESGRNEKHATGASKGFNNPTVPDKISVENARENQGTLSAKKQDAGVRKKKKRGPLTEEKRAKKKKKERIKRAQKNRQLGVKRLKIQPMLKPKTVSYCRHYLKGRCQKGEQCNFSHDTEPSTKSKPCCHFARQSCMKGDDCPYDHQLSKYPCNNYLSNGYCSRGTDCMFSHEVLPKEGCPSTSNVSIPELKSSSLLRGSNTEKQLNLQSSSTQKVDSKSGISVIAPCKNTEQNVAETRVKPAVQTPKGISKLLFGKSLLSNPSKIGQGGLSPKEGGVGVGPQTHHTPAMAQNSNEITRMAAAVESKGINFLSFGKAPLHDSSGEKPSSMPFSKDYGIQKSAYCDPSKDKQPALCAKKDEGLKVGNQMGGSAREMVDNLSEMPKSTPPLVPRGINFLSFGKAPLDDITKQASVSSNGDSAFLSSVQETESAPRVQIPNGKLGSLLSPSLPSDQSLDRLADKHGKGTPTSALKALLSNTPNSSQMANLSNASSSAHKALQSTLAFASKLESKIKMDHPAVSADFNKEGSSSHNTLRASTILDFLRRGGGGGGKTKQ